MADGTREEGFDRMTILNENDNYDAADNGTKCYNYAIRMIRLQKIKEGELSPNLDDPEEMETARQAGFQIVHASVHRRSA